MKNISIPPTVKNIFIIFAIVIAVFVYSFWGAKLEDQNKDVRTPEAYGVDSLEYQAEPIMEIRVWQRNDKSYSDYPDRGVHESFFYSILPLPLEEGASVDTVWQPRIGIEDAIIEASYDGNISGFYDLRGDGMLDYTGKTDRWPSYGVSGADVRRSEDGTFSGNKTITLSIRNWAQTWIIESLDPSRSEVDRGISRSILQSIESDHGFLFEDYYFLEYYRDVYPDAPVQDENYKNLKQLRRVVMTNHLTIQAMHPTKPDTPVATAVLEIKQVSSWFGPQGGLGQLNEGECGFMRAHCTSGDSYNDSYGTVTVVLYEQSDTFSMG